MLLFEAPVIASSYSDSVYESSALHVVHSAMYSCFFVYSHDGLPNGSNA